MFSVFGDNAASAAQIFNIITMVIGGVEGGMNIAKAISQKAAAAIAFQSIALVNSAAVLTGTVANLADPQSRTSKDQNGFKSFLDNLSLGVYGVIAYYILSGVDDDSLVKQITPAASELILSISGGFVASKSMKNSYAKSEEMAEKFFDKKNAKSLEKFHAYLSLANGFISLQSSFSQTSSAISQYFTTLMQTGYDNTNAKVDMLRQTLQINQKIDQFDIANLQQYMQLLESSLSGQAKTLQGVINNVISVLQQTGITE